MPIIRVDADDVASLGVGLTELADELAAQPDRADADRWALGPGESGEAFVDLVEQWRRARLELAHALRELGEAATRAGGAYLDTEESASAAFPLGGHP